MNGWRVKKNPSFSGDVPFYIGAIALAGAVVGAVLAVTVDVLVHRHRGG